MNAETACELSTPELQHRKAGLLASVRARAFLSSAPSAAPRDLVRFLEMHEVAGQDDRMLDCGRKRYRTSLDPATANAVRGGAVPVQGDSAGGGSPDAGRYRPCRVRGKGTASSALGVVRKKRVGVFGDLGPFRVEHRLAGPELLTLVTSCVTTAW